MVKASTVVLKKNETIACAVTMKLYLHDLHNEVDPSFAYKQDESETLHRDFGAFFSRLVACHTAPSTPCVR